MRSREPQLERLRQSDGDAIRALARRIGWSLSRLRVDAFLQTAVGYGHRIGGALVSSTLCFPYGKVPRDEVPRGNTPRVHTPPAKAQDDYTLLFVGLVMVDPDWQRRGLGKSVFLRCLEAAGVASFTSAGVGESYRAPVALVSTDAGYPLYASCGFRTVERLHRYSGPPQASRLERAVEQGTVGGKTLAIRPVCASDLDEIIALDRVAIGASRAALYPGFLTSVHRGYTARDSGSQAAKGMLRGFGFATEFGTELLVIGPIIAQDWATAVQLTVRLIGEWRQAVRFDIPACQREWMQWVQSIGIPEVHQSPLMLCGADALPGDRRKLFGIMDAALG